MIPKKKLKVFELQINPTTEDSTGVDVISLVQDPAIMKNFVAFSTEPQALKFKVTDSSRHIVTGPIMIPDILIYRDKRDNMGKIVDEWYITATKQSISQVIQKFFKTQRNANTSAEHDGSLLNGVYLIESFQVDSTRGILPPTGYGKIPDGTWFGSFKVENKEIWAGVQDGTFKGFSIEGLFTCGDTNIMAPKTNDLQIFKELSSVLTNI
jgi:hypothetical protein